MESRKKAERRQATITSSGILCFLFAGILVWLTVPILPIIIPSLAPANILAGLKSLESEGILYEIIWLVYLVSDLLFLVAFPALLFVMRVEGERKKLLVAGVVLNTLFVVIDVSVDIPLRLYLVRLSASYAVSASNASRQAGILETAQSTLNSANEAALVATLFQFTAVIVTSLFMLKTQSFGKSLGYIGFACGAIALMFIPAVILNFPVTIAGLFNLFGFVLLGAWSIITGYKLRNFQIWIKQFIGMIETDEPNRTTYGGTRISATSLSVCAENRQLGFDL